MAVTARQPEAAEVVGPVEAPVLSAMVVMARQLRVARQTAVAQQSEAAELVGPVEAPVLSAMVVTGVWKAVP